MTVFQWSVLTEKAAQLIAAGDLSIKQIAALCDVTRETTWHWRQHPEFIARIEEHQAEIRAEVRRHGVAVVEQRLASLDDRWRRLHEVIYERAADPSMQAVAGGKTGLLVRKLKSIGAGDNAEVVEEYAIDTGLLSELREHEKQVAQELGQWVARSDVTRRSEVTVIELPVKELHADDPAQPGPADVLPG